MRAHFAYAVHCPPKAALLGCRFMHICRHHHSPTRLLKLLAFTSTSHAYMPASPVSKLETLTRLLKLLSSTCTSHAHASLMHMLLSCTCTSHAHAPLMCTYLHDLPAALMLELLSSACSSHVHAPLMRTLFSCIHIRTHTHTPA